MAIDRYLAMTAAEIAAAPASPGKLGYMACHFSPYSTGLSNLPRYLPRDSILLLTDRTPIHSHDPGLIARQLSDTAERFRCRGILLDLQRPGETEAAELARCLISTLPCPVCVSQPYAEELDCPILLPPVPLNIPLAEYLCPWQGREIWLETAPDSLCITLTSDGVQYSSCGPLPTQGPHHDSSIHCHYRIQVFRDEAVFTLRRTPEDLDALLQEAESLGVTLAIGLYQELCDFWT